MKNVLLINRIGNKVYELDGRPLIDPSLYNLFFITKRDEACILQSSFYKESYIIEPTNDVEFREAIIDIALCINKRYPIDQVIALTEDHLIVAAEVRKILNIRGDKPEEVDLFINKSKMKCAIKESGIRYPKHTLLSDKEGVYDLFREFHKIVIKPLVSSGSVNTYFIDDILILENLIEKYALSLDQYEAEEFIDGEVYHCDSVIVNGEASIFSLSKYTRNTVEFKDGGFHGSVMIDDSALIERMQSFHKKVLNSLNITSGVTHLEVFLTKQNEIVFCEIAKRSGGAGIIPSIKNTYGIDLFQAQILCELEEALPPIKKGELSAWTIFWPRKGHLKHISHVDEFKDEFLRYIRIRASEGMTRPEAQHSAHADATFVVSGFSTKQLIDRLNMVENKFLYVVEDSNILLMGN